MIKVNNFSIKSSNTIKMLLCEVLMKEFEPLVPLNRSLKIERIKRVYFLEFQDSQGSDANFQILGVAGEPSSKSVKVSIDILINEIKSVVSDKFDFDY